MTKKVVTVESSEPVMKALQKIVEKGKPVGILTE